MDAIKVTYTAGSVDDLIEGMRPIATRIESCFSSGVSLYGAGFVGSWASRYLESIGAKVANFVDRDPRKEHILDGRRRQAAIATPLAAHMLAGVVHTLLAVMQARVHALTSVQPVQSS